MAEINLAKQIVDNFSDKDIISYIERNMNANLNHLDKAILNEHLGACGQASAHLAQLYEVVKAYNEKKGGKKSPTVI